MQPLTANIAATCGCCRNRCLNTAVWERLTSRRLIGKDLNSRGALSSSSSVCSWCS